MKSKLQKSHTLEQLERRQMMAVESYDGVGNNITHPDWGSTYESLLRLAKSAYGDGISSMAGSNRPSARVVSNTIAAHDDTTMNNARQLSSFGYLWGQFIDHDIDLTNPATPSETANIAVPKGDVYFDPNNTGTQTIGFTRSEYTSGTGVTTPRQQYNEITAFIDGSMVYGSDATRATALRTLSGGLMKTGSNDLLPDNTLGLDNATLGGPASFYFAAGDVRANENIELTSIQTLFMREHNRQAKLISAKNPTWNDEQIYQAARKMVIAEIQSITYNEFLPALLGQNAIPAYRGYRADVNPSIATEFSTAAFRLGHSMLADDVEFLNNDGTDAFSDIPLANAFFNPSKVRETGINSILKYLASSNSEEIDNKIVGGVRNFLFGAPGSGGFDLASLNIQRGRDHGLSDYNTTRAAIGLPRVASFAQITKDVTVQNQLKSLYGTVDNIDLWVGGLAEDHVAGSSLGQTFQRIVADQFTRIRDGDRFWYENSLSPADVATIRATRLSDIIQRNSGVANIQDNVFFFNAQITGRCFADLNRDGIANPIELGLPARQIQLLDDTGTVVATTMTALDGSYRFSNVQVGTYTIKSDNSNGWTIKTDTVQISSGVTYAKNDLAATRQDAPPPPPGILAGIQPPRVSLISLINL